MERALRFATTDDGVRIAYWVAGRLDGPPLIECTGALFGTEISTEIPIHAEMLARFCVIAFDHRGFGTSARDVGDITPELLVSDLAAVVDAVGFRQVALNAMHDGCATALTYAAMEPQRVSRIAMIAPFTRASDFLRPEAVAGFVALVRGDWNVAARTLADIAMPNLQPPERDMYSRHYVTMTSPVNMARFVEAFARMDVSRALPNVRAPVLIYHERDYSFIPFRLGQEVASALPHATFVPIEHRGAAGFALRDHAGQMFSFLAGDPLEPITEASGARPAAGHGATISRPLTPREAEVLRLLAAGRSNRQLAEELVLSERTVARHIANIYAKIDAHGRAEATAYALRHGLA
jgi:pimeloyl-ACP methyl ester carboxylesterase